jgi:hypothetical protein
MVEDLIKGPTDGIRVLDYLLPPNVELYRHEDGLLHLWLIETKMSVGIDPKGMSEGELERAISAGTEVLLRQPINRQQRRAQLKGMH